jgi:hypothetical protein
MGYTRTALRAEGIDSMFLQLKPVQGHPRWVSIEQRALASVFGQVARTELFTLCILHIHTLSTLLCALSCCCAHYSRYCAHGNVV